MLFKPSFLSLEIQIVIAWLILLFQPVIFFIENSLHHKQSKKGARMGAFFMAGFVKNCCSGAARPFLCRLLVFFSYGPRRPPLLFPMDKTAFILKFIANAGSSIVSVQFYKADGMVRTIQFNPRDRQEIKGTGTPTTKANIVRCRDFRQAKQGNAAWRSFDTERVISIQANGQHVFYLTCSAFLLLASALATSC